MNLNIDLAYGRANFVKKSFNFRFFFKCVGNINLLDEYPIYYFHCLVNSPNKTSFLRIFQ